MSVTDAGHKVRMGRPLDRTQAICDMLDDMFGFDNSVRDTVKNKAEWAGVSRHAVAAWYRYVNSGGARPGPGEYRHANGFPIMGMRAYILMAKYMEETDE